jgi:tetratricopeptide (TPR) repeat protein
MAQLQDDAATAAEGYGKAVEQRLAILKQRPASINARRLLGGAHLNYGDSLCYTGQYDKALEQYRAALPLTEQVVLSEPDSRHARGQVAHANYCVACVTVLTDRKLAQKYFQAALKIREEVYREAEALKSIGRMELNTLMLTLAWCGEHERAATFAAQLAVNASPKVLAEDVGATYGICYGVVGADKLPEQLTAEEHKLRSHYLKLALDAFRRAIAGGYDGIYYLERDPDILPLRGVPEYEALLVNLRKSRSNPKR